MTNTTYEFTAFTEADLLDAGAEGHSVSCGDTFTMSGATTCFEVTDNDAFLSGDNYCNENANDQYGQQASITGENGQEIGNGGQIYAEKYFWVCDDAGNWYVMLQIEQEGTGEEYFTFFNGYGYETPAEGTELTVYSSCNVTSNWIDFKDLDAGEKGPDTGSISGRVFNDEDCDGIDGGVTVIEGSDYTIEAEDMDAWGFKTVQGAYASGGELVKLQCAGQSAAIKTDFQGKDGVYDVSLFIQDETDGKSKIKLLVNGQVVEAIRLDRQSDGVGSNNGGFSEFVVEGVELKAGDEVKIWAEGNGYEFVRIDKLEFNGRDQEIRTEEPGKEGVVVVLLDANGDEVLDGNGDRIETVTDANGEYTFDGVPVGDYRVKFENPDGTEFTFQNVGSDDTIDSDVNGNGVSDVISVVADQTTSDVDAGLKPVVELGSIAGRYFCDENDDGAETDGAGNFEAGVAGATVWLLLQGTGVIASTTTDDDGNYSFDGLEAGNYSVRFEDPDDVSSATEGKNFIAANQGDDATDSDVVDVGGAGNGNTATFTLGAGENKTDVDGGIKQQFMVCDDPDAVLIDFEGFAAGTVIDDEYAAIGVTISAQRATNNNAANDAMVFDSANPTGGDPDLQTFNQGNLLIVSEDNDSNDPDDAVGGVITFDFDNPSRIFDLKVVDTEEGGTVELFDADGASLGVIDLPNLQDGGLEQVMIDVDGVSQMVVTLNGSGAIDDICLVPGQPEPGSLSGRYFFDADRDGLDNDVDNGISGIQVELLDENGVGLNVFETTDAQGNYSFGDLAAGTYGVKFTDPDTGRELTTQNANGNGNDDIDSDAADIGGGMSTINGITVVAGADTPDNDAGVVELLGSLSGRYFCDDDGDGLDNDGANGGEGQGVEGILVTLLDANGNPVLDGNNQPVTTQTGPNGAYSFTGLAPAIYGVNFAETPVDKEFTTANVGNDDAIDSDAIADDFGGASILGIEVVGGQDTPDNDAGVTTSNADPDAEDVAAAVCADDMAVISLIDAVTDPDGDTISIVSISDADETAGVGEFITLESGGVATLNADGTVSFNPNGAYDDLLIREMEMDQFSFTASDGNGGTDTAIADIKICGALNTIETITESLPDEACFTITEFTPEGGYVALIESTDARIDGLVIDAAFCLDNFDAEPMIGAKITADLYTTIEDLPGDDVIVQNEANLDSVNFLLNLDLLNTDSGTFDGGVEANNVSGTDYSDASLQEAIWLLLNDQPNPDGDVFLSANPDALELRDYALAEGDGFVPGEGDAIGLIFEPLSPDVNGNDVQSFILSVPFQTLEEDCDCVL